jgi:hypothetical protein
MPLRVSDQSSAHHTNEGVRVVEPNFGRPSPTSSLKSEIASLIPASPLTLKRQRQRSNVRTCSEKRLCCRWQRNLASLRKPLAVGTKSRPKRWSQATHHAVRSMRSDRLPKLLANLWHSLRRHRLFSSNLDERLFSVVVRNQRWVFPVARTHMTGANFDTKPGRRR